MSMETDEVHEHLLQHLRTIGLDDPLHRQRACPIVHEYWLKDVDSVVGISRQVVRDMEFFEWHGATLIQPLQPEPTTHASDFSLCW